MQTAEEREAGEGEGGADEEAAGEPLAEQQPAAQADDEDLGLQHRGGEAGVQVLERASDADVAEDGEHTEDQGRSEGDALRAAEPAPRLSEGDATVEEGRPAEHGEHRGGPRRGGVRLAKGEQEERPQERGGQRQQIPAARVGRRRVAHSACVWDRWAAGASRGPRWASRSAGRFVSEPLR